MELYRWMVAPSQRIAKAGNYLRYAMPLLPEKEIRTVFSRRDVKMDGIRIGAEDEIRPGAEMTVYTGYTVRLPVVYEDGRILLLNKPAGLCTDDPYAGMTVLSLLERERGEAFRLCHRLDTRTSGLLLLCRDERTEGEAAELFKNRLLKKEYECLVRGEMRPKEAVCEAYLVKDSRAGTVRVVSHRTPGAKQIRTGYRCIEKNGEISRLRVDLLTGRTHQIRAHMAYLNHPILGDDLYGDREFNRRNHSVGDLKLCAVSLTLFPPEDSGLHDLSGQTFSIPAPF